jgi:hypothetical protein
MRRDIQLKDKLANRKGTVSYLIRVIIAAVLILTVTVLAWKVGAILTGFGVEQECQAVLTTGGIMQYINPNAPIRATKPSQQFDTDISLCPVNTIKYRDKKNHDSIVEDVANEMISCYNKYGRGEVNLFEQNPGRDLYCIMCTYISFGDIPGPVDGLFEFMDETDIRGLGITYSEFLAGSSQSSPMHGASITPSGEEFMMDTEKEYAIYYVYSKTKHYWDDRLGNHIKAGSYGLGAGVAGGVLLAVVTGGGAVIIVPVMTIVGISAGTLLTPDVVHDEYTGAVMITEYDADIIRQYQCTKMGVLTG